VKKALSIFLSALLFFSSTGFTVSNHYCKGSLEKVKIGFSSENLSCDMMKTEPTCKRHPAANKMKKTNCCSNQFIHFSLPDTFEKVSVQKTEINPDFLVAYILVSKGYDPFVHEKDHSFLFYSPPLLERDIPVLVQSFLI
jgi:hypothetical protein